MKLLMETSVSGYPINLHCFDAAFETFLLHGIGGSDLGNLDHTECHHVTTVIVHKCVSTILGTMSRAVTMPITI